MLTDLKIQNLRAREKNYKVTDREGLYVTVTPKGTKVFRYDYQIGGKRKTLTIGKYGRSGISLSQAREYCAEAKRMVAEGVSPALEKKRAKQRRNTTETIAEFAPQYLEQAQISESTRSMRRSVMNRDILPELGSHRLDEVTGDDVRALCNRIKDRGAPSTAVIARDIVKQMYAHAILHGMKIDNPASEVAPASIATFKPKDRALTPAEIKIVFELLERVKGNPVLKLGFKLILLTMKRKSEISYARWDEIDFEDATWTIPKERMKNGLPHVVYLSHQAIDILVALHTVAHGSAFVFPKRNDLSVPVSTGTFNRFTYEIRDLAKIERIELEHFTVHDLRRTGSTLLNEMGFNRDWIEKALAHEDRFSSRGVYNKAQYAEQRRHMMQEWADMIDAWIKGEKRVPNLNPGPNTTAF
ncbi:MAG: integrase arm-type DNA-binding domain-containing protein [Pseudomonadota bacterium]